MKTRSENLARGLSTLSTVSTNARKRAIRGTISESAPSVYGVSTASTSSSALQKYAAALDAWTPESFIDLPICPPFRFGEPEHGAAWGLWWDAITRRNDIYRGNSNADS